ncbi:MAG: hypothetical protein VW881_08790, partial [Alphaproteobacteria bacterium]
MCVASAPAMSAAMPVIVGFPFLLRDRRIDRRAFAIAAILRIGQAVPRFAVVGIDDMAAGAARLAIIARLVVGAHEPHE